MSLSAVDDAHAAAPSAAERLAHSTVLVRTDFTSGLDSGLAPALRRLCDAGARVAVLAGYGAPAGDVNPALSLLRFRDALEAAAGLPVTFVSDCVGPVAEAALHRVAYGQIALLENVRFHPEFRRDSRAFALRLSVLGEYFLVTGPVPSRPIGWLSALRQLLPAPPDLSAFPKEP